MAVLFLDVLRKYLRGLGNAREGRDREVPTIDLPMARRHFLEAAEAWEGRNRARGADLSPEPHAQAWGWLCHDRGDLDAFLRLVASELSDGLCAGTDAETLQRTVHHAVDLLVEPPERGSTGVREREIGRVIEDALETLEDGVLDIARYALEVRVVRTTASGTAISSIGRVLLGSQRWTPSSGC